MIPKLIQTLTTLSKDEWASLRAHCDLHLSKGSDDASLFNFLHSKRRILQHTTDWEQIRKKRFPKLSSKGFSNALSRVNRHLESWLILKEIEEQEFSAELHLVKAYNRRGLYKHADHLYNVIQKKLDKKNPPYIYESKVKAQLYHFMYYSDNPIKYREKGKLLEKLVTTHLHSWHDQSYLYQLEMTNWGKMTQYDYDHLKLSIDNMLKASPSTTQKKILESAQRLLTERDYDSYQVCWEHLRENRITPGSEFSNIIYFYVMMNTMHLWGSKKITDKDACIDVFNYGLKTGILLQGGKIPVIRFHNIISSLGLLNDYDKTESFINSWYQIVDTQDPPSTKKLGQAQNAFYHKRYHEINPLLRGVRYENLNQKIRAQVHELVGLYMDSSVGPATIKNSTYNFKRMISRNKKKLSDTVYKSIHAYASIIEEMVSSRYTDRDIDLTKYPSIYLRQWIEEQVEIIKKQN